MGRSIIEYLYRFRIIFFLTLLTIYILATVLSSGTELKGDEERYIGMAKGMVEGNYSIFWNGPGYPIVLMPFDYFSISWFYAKLLNPLFLFFSVIFFYRTCELYASKERAFYGAILISAYYPFVRFTGWLVTETITIFLVCAFIYFFCRYFKRQGGWFLPSLVLAYLALTKIVFAYVIIVCLAVSILYYALCRNKKLLQFSLILSTALILCSPYILFTFSATGKPFYWGSAGGMSLYWMSSPVVSDYGDWHSFDDVKNNPERYSDHVDFFEDLSVMSPVERDSLFKKQALINIKTHPIKFIKNWISNIGRMMFQMPYSYTAMKLRPLFYAVPNMFIFVLTVFSIYPLVWKRKDIPIEILLLLGVASVYFGGSSLLSAYSRHFWPVVPILVLWLYFCSIRILKIEFILSE